LRAVHKQRYDFGNRYFSLVATLLAIIASCVLLVGIPHFVFKDIEQQTVSSSALITGPHMEVFYDIDRTLNPIDLFQIEPDNLREFDGHKWLEKPLSTTPVWAKVPIRWHSDVNITNEQAMKSRQRSVFVDFGFATLNFVTVYLMDADGNVLSEQTSGDHIPVNKRPLPLIHPVFSFDINLDENYFIVAKLDSDSAVNTSLAISDAKQQIVSVSHLNFFTGLYIGILGVVFFYNLFILIAIRKVAYLYYVLYVFFLLCYQAISEGVVGQYLWTHSGAFLDRGNVYFGGLANIFALLFVRQVLDLSRYVPKLDKVVWFFLPFASLSFVIELLFSSELSSIWMMLTVGVSTFLIPIIGITAAFNNSPLAKNFMMAWVVYTLLLSIYILSMLGMIQTNYDMLNTIRFGSALEAILLSFVLAAQMSQLRKEKDDLRRAYSEELELQVQKISEAAMSLSKGHLNVRCDIGENERLGHLSKVFNHFADHLQVSHSERKRWLSDISHELRTPLTVIRGELESMYRGILPVNEEALKRLNDESIHITHLVDDLHDLSLLESKEMLLNCESLQVFDAVLKVVENHQRVLEENDISVNLEAKDKTVSVFVDAVRFQQVLTNLMINTIKYTDTSGQLVINIEAVDGQVTLHWMDSTPGVVEKSLPHLFSRLYRGETSRTRKMGGAGLGLTLCRAIILRLGGTISAKSSTLGGLQIDISIPEC
jgi:signal transduction histidine kinase